MRDPATAARPAPHLAAHRQINVVGRAMHLLYESREPRVQIRDLGAQPLELDSIRLGHGGEPSSQGRVYARALVEGLDGGKLAGADDV